MGEASSCHTWSHSGSSPVVCCLEWKCCSSSKMIRCPHYPFVLFPCLTSANRADEHPPWQELFPHHPSQGAVGYLHQPPRGTQPLQAAPGGVCGRPLHLRAPQGRRFLHPRLLREEGRLPVGSATSPLFLTLVCPSLFFFCNTGLCSDILLVF